MSLSLVLAAALSAAGPAGCSPEAPDRLLDGYYTAEAADFDPQGWKEFLTIYVSAGRIVSAEYDARNASGFLRTWDIAEMRTSNNARASHQIQAARAYRATLLTRQDPTKIGPLPGLAQAHPAFQRLAEAAVAQARSGDPRVVFVPPADQKRPE